jgi:hypothetical protein
LVPKKSSIGIPSTAGSVVEYLVPRRARIRRLPAASAIRDYFELLQPDLAALEHDLRQPDRVELMAESGRDCGIV